MSDERSLTNFDRLLGHLPKESLSSRLVAAYTAPTAEDALAALKKEVSIRLDELRRRDAKDPNR